MDWGNSNSVSPSSCTHSHLDNVPAGCVKVTIHKKVNNDGMTFLLNVRSVTIVLVVL